VINRSEGAGVTVAIAGHVVLFGLLSVGFLATPNPLSLRSDPIEVSITDDVGLESQVLEASTEDPKTQYSPEQGPVEPEPEPAEASEPEKVKKPEPTTRPEPDPNAKTIKLTKSEQSSMRKQTERGQRKSTGQLGAEFEKGLTAEATKGESTKPPGTNVGPVSQSSLIAEIRRQVMPYWQPLGGLDARDIKTYVRIRLTKQGTLIGAPEIVKQENVTSNNRGPASILQQRALAAIKAASPIDTAKLPAEHYDAWDDVTLVFDRRK
jgi:hypothetical protein